ncbi:hypothetical protein GCM10010517_05170 [Streptosporangium fragile]|uniref:Bacterial Pleckstrin homology domain-containing protein n=1 Tax=Streptosporangium fragile TaxID=46186 RepID=A0ABP6I5Z0_9ACTN
MAHIELTADTLTVHVEGLNRLLALKSRLEVPLAHVRHAEVGGPSSPGGLRAPGTRIPGVISAGTFHVDYRKVFWDVRDPAKAVVIDLSGADFDQLVVEVDDPQAVAASIRAALR